MRTKVNGSTTLNQNRTHNVANEITDITETTGTAWPTPTHNANGNLTLVPRPLSLGNSFDLKYDAWNRLIEVKLTGSSVVATYRYDGASRRVSQDDGTNVRHHYYSDQWQILEERLNSATTADKRFVWGLRYLDDLILRDHGGTRHYVLHDYFNVTAIVNTSGTVQERYGYDAFGAVRFLNASFGSASSGYTWETLYGAYRYDSNTGLYQVRHRYLHPKLGRWTKRDPVGETAGDNLYMYVSNFPHESVDYFGLMSAHSCQKLVDAIMSSPGQHSKNLRLILEAIRKAGCKPLKPKCKCCGEDDSKGSIGYIGGDGKELIICANSQSSTALLLETLVHENIHVLQTCRGMEKQACEGAVCAEIQASLHDGTCQRVSPKNVRECVIESAAASAANRCPSLDAAREQAEALYEQCIARPF